MEDIDFREQTEGRPFPLPPASFEFLTESLRLQAEMQLGLMRLGPEEGPPRDLDLARHTIDLLGMLQEKTRGNLTLEEQRLIDNSLTMLRFRYVQAIEENAKSENAAPGDAATQSAAAESSASDSPKE